MIARQKLIAVALAIPVIGMVVYFSTRDNGDIVPPAPPTPVENPIAAANEAIQEAEKATTDAGLSEELLTLRSRAQARLTEIEALTKEQYDVMRAARKNLPATLEEYKSDARKHTSSVMTMTQEEYEKRLDHVEHCNSKTSSKSSAKDKKDDKGGKSNAKSSKNNKNTKKSGK